MPDHQKLSIALPNELVFTVDLDTGSDATSSYIDISIKDVTGTDNVFEGLTFDGYCLDAESTRLGLNVEYTAKVYSSYE